MPEDSRRVFQENLKYYMSSLNITQQDIVNALGVSKSTVSDWCHGKNYPRIDVMQRLADFLGVVMNKLTISNDHSDEYSPEEKQLISNYRNSSNRVRASLMDILGNPHNKEVYSLTPDESLLIEGYRALPDQGKQYMLQQLTAANAIYGGKDRSSEDSSVG